jgi:L-ascorbate metabolism protein UlaG (beta-lactamase superfamily)
MTINWYGQSCFQILISAGKSETTSIIIDPFNESIGLKLPRKLEADVALVTHNHDDHNNVKRISNNPFVINSPGEYDIKEIFVQGIPSFHNEKGEKNTIYKIEAEKIKLCHLGDLGQKELTTEQLETIGDVDILMIPVGGVFTIGAQEAVKIMSQIEPKITIPMHYKLPGLNIKLDPLDNFLKVLGIDKLEKVQKLSIKEKDLPQDEEAKIIVLEP